MSVFPKTSLLYLLVFGLLLNFMSCDNELAQDAISPDFVTEEEMPDLLIESLPPPPDADPEELDRRLCFRFVYPIQVQIRNGELITAENAEDLRAAHQQIIASRVLANFVYPFDIEMANGTTVTINNFLGLRRLYRACRDFDDADITPCITINYPIEVTTADSAFTVNNALELLQANRDFRPRGVSIIYPIDVTHTASGRVVTINGDRELYRLRQICHNRGDYDDRGLPCYRLMFPLDITVNGNQITLVGRIGWRFAVRNIPEEADVSIVYPITIVNRETGEEIEIASHDEWEAARELCD
ncbi:hypothetical protein FUA23_07815 [Neolewinella aurantiaca]|uniref:Uncharacterized protein n=1 Tax=Neolewinella aurantiaca TaxID=2602767 RepID=A0A5C7FUY1_9BACT|nr:hypothetical protein [Neolewinella aurantiaca]TXF90137.1 hypothetical protein FUA23_07815 [Neolewinella aurantiaca]